MSPNREPNINSGHPAQSSKRVGWGRVSYNLDGLLVAARARPPCASARPLVAGKVAFGCDATPCAMPTPRLAACCAPATHGLTHLVGLAWQAPLDALRQREPEVRRTPLGRDVTPPARWVRCVPTRELAAGPHQCALPLHLSASCAAGSTG